MLHECGLALEPGEAQALFDHFDRDRSGSIDYDEFVSGVRGGLNARRKALVGQAFERLDKDGSGVIEPDEIVDAYDASKHPDVLSGRKTAGEVLGEFLDTFDVGGVHDGKVTRDEFANYYANVSANIDDDDYFELMMRNAWHISGGEGWCANTANRRVLVTHADGRKSVEEIHDDLGLKADDRAGMVARLRAQGLSPADVSTFDGGDDMGYNDAPLPPPPPPPGPAAAGLSYSPTNHPSLAVRSLNDQVKFAETQAARSAVSEADAAIAARGAGRGAVSLSAVGAAVGDGDLKPAAKPDPAPAGGAAKREPTAAVNSITAKIKAALAAHGAHGFHGLQARDRQTASPPLSLSAANVASRSLTLARGWA